MRTWTILVALVVLVAGAGLASAHGWAVDVDPQVVGDGTVVVRHVSMVEGGYLAVHIVQEDEPGPVVGHVRFGGPGEHDHVEIPLEGDAWAEFEGSAEFVTVVHTDDGDGEFDWPDGDDVFQPDDPVADRFAVEKADGDTARVVGVAHDSDGTVTLRRVDLPDEGFVVLYEDVDGERGDVVGVERLPAGHHENVSVPVAPRFYNEQGNYMFLIAGLHADDGDDGFQSGADPAITVEGSAVITHFYAERTRSSIPTATPSPTASPSPTPTPTMASPTATPPASPTAADVDQPGFGSLSVLAALALLAFHIWARRE